MFALCEAVRDRTTARRPGELAPSCGEGDVPPWSVLKPRDNRLVYTVNRRDLDYTDVVEVGFVIPLLIR